MSLDTATQALVCTAAFRSVVVTVVLSVAVLTVVL